MLDQPGTSRFDRGTRDLTVFEFLRWQAGLATDPALDRITVMQLRNKANELLSRYDWADLEARVDDVDPWFRIGTRSAAHHVRTSATHWGATLLGTDCGTAVAAGDVAAAPAEQPHCKVCELAAPRATRPSFTLPTEAQPAVDLDAVLKGE